MILDNPFENFGTGMTPGEQTKTEIVAQHKPENSNEDPFAFVDKKYSAKQASYTKTKVIRYVYKSN